MPQETDKATTSPDAEHPGQAEGTTPAQEVGTVTDAGATRQGPEGAGGPPFDLSGQQATARATTDARKDHAAARGGRRLRALVDPDTWRRPATWARLGLAAAVMLYVSAFVTRAWVKHARFDIYGYDVGIFDQLVWQLSRFEEPFSTIRGIPTFGDHSSYLLVLVAPLYWLWADPRTLLVLQVVFMALPAIPVYLIAARHLRSEPVALVLAVAYLAYPTMQWASTFEFHPETLAAGLIGLAYLAADRQQPRRMALWLGLAMLAKEDVSLVVAGFGVTLMLTGRRRWGAWTAVSGLAYFALVTFVLIPAALGAPVSYLETRYGITAEGVGVLVQAGPVLLGNLLRNASSDAGTLYLALILLPLAGLPLLAWRWLVPALPVLVLNLASLQPLQYNIRFHYLAVASVVLAVAAVMGAARIASGHPRRLFAPAVVLLACALFYNVTQSPAPWAAPGTFPPDSPVHATRTAALDLVPDDAAVSVSRNLVPRVSRRSQVYQFPNPWLTPDLAALKAPIPTQEQQDGIDFVVVDRAQLGFGDQVPSGEQTAFLEELRTDPEWTVAFDQDGIIVLERRASP